MAAKSKRITVRGKQRAEIDPELFVQILVAIALEMAQETKLAPTSPDVFDAAIEDSGAAS
jgi:hypothetical protein